LGLISKIKRFVKPDSRIRQAVRVVRQELRAKDQRRARTGVNLNVGSGSQTIVGFTSLDIDTEWYRYRGREFIEYNMIKDPLPNDDGTVDNIYCSHVVEHLPNAVVLRFLREAHRVLRDGGTLRIACPDAEFLWDVSSFPNGYWKWRDPWFGDTSCSSDPSVRPRRSDYFVREVATPNCTLYRNRRNDVAYDDSIFDSDFDSAINSVVGDLNFTAEFPGDHINPWTFAKLKGFAESAGFKKIVRSKRGGSVSEIMQHKDFDQTCPQMSMYVDLVKG